MTALVLLALAAEPIAAIEHARVHTGDGRRIDDGTVLVRGRTVAAVGPAAEIAVPPEARRIDGRGAWVTPGLVDAQSQVGVLEIAGEPSTVDAALDEQHDAVRAAFSVIDGFNPRSIVIPITRMEGVTAAVVAPWGGLVAGRGALVRLAGERLDQMLVRAPVGVWANAGARAAGQGARGGVLLRLRELVDDVRQYARRRDDFERNQMRRVAASRLDLEALIPVVEGKLPLVVEAHRASDLRAVLRLAREERLRLVLSGAEEGWLVAAEIAEAGVPVLLSALPNLPRSFDVLGARSDNAALLARAGVKIALTPRERGHHRSRALRFEAGNAVAHGLPWEAALAAITRTPGEIFGAPVGTIAPGRAADLVVWSGDPFEPLTRVRHLFVEGHELPLTSRQTALRDRYRDLTRARPRP